MSIFNITFGKPLSQQSSIKSLVTRSGNFIPLTKVVFNKIAAQDIQQEFTAQLDRFAVLFKRLPSHIDTHHHTHYFKPVYDLVANVARVNNIPIRKRFKSTKTIHDEVITTDYMHARFNPFRGWTTRTIVNAIKKIKNGTHELIVHPGIVDAQLKAISSFSHARAVEYEALGSVQYKEALQKSGARVINFSQLKQLYKGSV